MLLRLKPKTLPCALMIMSALQLDDGCVDEQRVGKLQRGVLGLEEASHFENVSVAREHILPSG
jgi:hypothetical protein